MTTMDDLVNSARVRHVRWGREGFVNIYSGMVFVLLDGTPLTEVRPGGSIAPEDLEIIPEVSS